LSSPVFCPLEPPRSVGDKVSAAWSGDCQMESGAWLLPGAHQPLKGWGVGSAPVFLCFFASAERRRRQTDGAWALMS